MDKAVRTAEFARELIAEVEELLPRYNASPEDFVLNEGNVAVAVIGPDGDYHGKMFGSGRTTAMQCARVAMKKATQVWITGLATGEYERRAFSGEIDESKFGIQRPDYIGWEGGIPARTKDGLLVALAFSGYRGENDVRILELALEKLGAARV
jgi:glc operon protein GlcG